MPPTLPLLDLPFMAELTAQRRDIHAHPELAFDEYRTADLVARELERYGLEVHRGIARTGVVGVLRAGIPYRKAQRQQGNRGPAHNRQHRRGNLKAGDKIGTHRNKRQCAAV